MDESDDRTPLASAEDAARWLVAMARRGEHEWSGEWEARAEQAVAMLRTPPTYVGIMREDVDDLRVFLDEDQAAEYAELWPDAQDAVHLRPLDRDAAAAVIEQSRADAAQYEREDDEDGGRVTLLLMQPSDGTGTCRYDGHGWTWTMPVRNTGNESDCTWCGKAHGTPASPEALGPRHVVATDEADPEITHHIHEACWGGFVRQWAGFDFDEVRQTSCRDCDTDVEGWVGDIEWRDRGGDWTGSDGHRHFPTLGGA